MARSTQTTSTRACNLRFVNNSSQRTLDILWLNYEGTEQKYAAVPPNSQHVQSTYASSKYVLAIEGKELQLDLILLVQLPSPHTLGLSGTLSVC